MLYHHGRVSIPLLIHTTEVVIVMDEPKLHHAQVILNHEHDNVAINHNHR